MSGRSWLGLGLVALAAAGCGASLPAPEGPDLGVNGPGFLALGDSYTIGEGEAASARWPEQVAVSLRTDGVAVGAPRIVARTGWTTGSLAAAMDGEDLVGVADFGVVTLMIGVNDQFRGGDVDAYDAALVTLLDRAIALAGDDPARVVVISIPDWSSSPWGERLLGGPDLAVAAEIDAFNAVARARAETAGAAWVDVTEASRRAGGDPSMFAEDGLHPSRVQLGLWADAITPAVRAALARAAVTPTVRASATRPSRVQP